MDIRLIRKELQVQFGNLNNVDYTNSSIIANDFWDFIIETDKVSELLEKLPENTVNLEQWAKDFYQSGELVLPRQKQERMAFLLAVFEKYKDDLEGLAHYFNISSMKITDHIRKYVDDMVKPLYQYLDGELHKQEMEIQPVSSISITANGNAIIVNGDNIGTISQTNNNTVQLLNELAEHMQKTTNLADEQKLEVINNIDTIKSQVVSPKPNGQIIKLAWETVSAMATLAGANDFVTKVTPLLLSLIG